MTYVVPLLSDFSEFYLFLTLFFLSDRFLHAHLAVRRSSDRQNFLMQSLSNKKLSYRRVTARCVLSVVILPIATQQGRNYLYDKS